MEAGEGGVLRPVRGAVGDAAPELLGDLLDPADDVATQGARARYLDVYRDVRTGVLPAGPATFRLPALEG